MSVMVGKPLFTFVDASTKMSVAEFAQAHGPAFFVLVTNQPSRPEHRGKTEWNPVSAKAPANEEEKTGDTGVYVLPLVRKPANQSGILRVGRGESCDVVVVDVTISKLHAFVIETRPGAFELFDAGSRNGTFVSETEVAARGTGPATPLTPRAKVRFGSVSMTFLDAEQLHAAAKARAR
jgi:pSer/pThr/pTyr-binding forkhead associated (FHA) protein